MIIIGITGTLGSGKGTAVEYLKDKYGFKHFSASDFINEEVTRRGLPINRDNQQIVANDLRTKYGGSFVAENLYERAMKVGDNAVLESLRAIGEIESLRKKPGHFYLLAVDADSKVRYDRVTTKRKGEKDSVTYEHFVEQEQKEMHDSSPGGMNIAQCMKMADAHIDNSGNMEELQTQIDEFIRPLLALPTENKSSI